MSKERKTVTLDPEVKAYLDSAGRNASETVNHLVKLEMGEDVVNEQILQMRLEMEKSRYEDAAQKAKGHLQRVNKLRDRLTNVEEKRSERLSEAKEALDGTELVPDNPAIQHWAKELEITPEELIQELNE